MLCYDMCHVAMVIGSVRADSQAASRVEQTLSEVASSLGSFIPQKQGPRQCWLLQVQIWMHIGTYHLLYLPTCTPGDV